MTETDCSRKGIKGSNQSVCQEGRSESVSQKEAEEAIRAYAKKQAREAVRARIAERGRRSEDRENSTHRRGTGKWERRTGMRFMHLSDLHIGKRVNEFSMLEDQRFILKQILDLARQQQVDGVWIAGDIYDKTVPSGEAVQLFDEFLTALAAMGISCFAISGNHDSPERISFGAKLVEQSGIYLSQVFRGEIAPVELKDEFGGLRIYLLPFLKPAHVRAVYPEEKIENCEHALEIVLSRMKEHWDPNCRNVLLAHQFVEGAQRCDSEEFSVGGLDQVSADIFREFDYVALGHIHTPQWVGRETVRYCGTPLKYSFSEVNVEKTVTIVELLEKGHLKIRELPLKPRKDMRKIRGSYLELTALETYQGTEVEDYLQVTLTDEEDVPDALGKLRSIYPNIMKLEYDNQRTRKGQAVEASAPEHKTPLELFEELYQIQNNQPMKENQRKLASELMETIWESQ